MDNLPTIQEELSLPRKSERVLMEQMSALDARSTENQKIIENFAGLLGNALVNLSNVVLTMHENQKRGLDEIKEVARVERDRDLETAMLERFSQLSTQLSVERGQIVGALDAVKSVVEAVEARETPTLVPTLETMKNATEATTAAINGIATVTDTKVARLDNMLSDVVTKVDALARDVQALGADTNEVDYTPQLVGIHQELVVLTSRSDLQQNTAADFARQLTNVQSEFSRMLDAAVDQLSQRIQSNAQGTSGQFAELRTQIVQAHEQSVQSATLLTALTESVASLAEAVEALAEFVKPLPSEPKDND